MLMFMPLPLSFNFTFYVSWHLNINMTKDEILHYLKQQFKQGDVVIKLIYINIALFLSYSVVRVFEFVFRIKSNIISSFFENWLALPADIAQLKYKFYTLFTYQFVHFDFFHVLINVMMLFFLGKLLLQYIGFKKVLPLYLLGGLVGGVVFVLIKFANIIAVSYMPVVGASASIMALMGALGTIVPNYNIKFFFADIKLKWLLLGFATLNFLSISSPNGAASGILHLAGLGFGYAYIYLDKEGVSLYKPVNKLINKIMSWFNKAPQPKVSFINKEKISKQAKETPKAQDQMDKILQKIAEHGYDSLTKHEKELLFSSSNN